MSLFQEQFNKALASKLALQRAQTEHAQQQAAWYGSKAASDISLQDAQRALTEAQAKDIMSRANRASVPAIPYSSRINLPRQPVASAIDLYTNTTTPKLPTPTTQRNILSSSLLDNMPYTYGWNGFLDSMNSPRFGYAEGGAVVPDTPMHPLYKQYLIALHRAGMLDRAEPPQVVIPKLAQYAAQERLKLAQQANMGGTQGYARGGEVDVGGKLVVGPGSPKSDSIPATIDGRHKAALSTGEFVFPRKAVEFYGTKVLDAMVEKARQALRKQAITQV